MQGCQGIEGTRKLLDWVE